MVLAETLESRVLMTAVNPTALEQYFVELINRARARPAAEASRFDITLNEGLDAGTLTKSPKQPLAINRFLVSSGRKYSKRLLDPGNPVDGELNHLIGGTSPGSRAMDEGFPHAGVGENLAWNTTSSSSPTLAAVLQNHELLFKDFTATFEVVGRGHRKNILKEGYSEIGIGLTVGSFGGRNAQVAAQEFANFNGEYFLTGVAFTDAVTDDDFYTPGEGIGKITVKAVRESDDQEFSTKTWAAGGYTLELEPGTYTITASGEGLPTSQIFRNVVISDANVKLDFTKPGTTDKTKPTAPKPSVEAADVAAAGGDDHTFTITYHDNHGLRRTSIGNGNVRVKSTDGSYSELAELVSKTGKGHSVVATYRVPAPGGSWNTSDDGSYNISIVKNQVKDSSGLTVAAGKVGSFEAAIPAGARPLAVGSTAPQNIFSRERMSDRDLNEWDAIADAGFLE